MISIRVSNALLVTGYEKNSQRAGHLTPFASPHPGGIAKRCLTLGSSRSRQHIFAPMCAKSETDGEAARAVSVVAAAAAAGTLGRPSLALADSGTYSWADFKADIAGSPERMVKEAAEVSSTGAAVVEDVTEVVEDAVEDDMEVVTNTLEAVSDTVEDAAEDAVEMVTDTYEAISATVEDAVEGASDFVTGMFEAVRSMPKAEPTPAVQDATDLVVEASKALNSTTTAPSKPFVEEASDLVSEAFKSPPSSTATATPEPAVKDPIDLVSEALKALPSSTPAATPKPPAPTQEFSVPEFKLPELSVPDMPAMPSLTVPKGVEDASVAASSIFGNAADKMSEATASLSSGLNAVTEGADGLRDSLENISGINLEINLEDNQVVTSAQSALSQALSQMDTTAFPPEFAELLSKATEDDQLAVALLALVAALPIGTATVISQVIQNISSGIVKPQEAFDALQNENAFLVDTRSESEREANGIPELKRKARGKGLSLQIDQVEGPIRRELDNPGAVEVRLAALKAVAMTRTGATVYIMNSTSSSKELSRAVAGCGRRSFVVEGGFKGWENAGLPVEEKTNYDASVVTTVLDELEAFSGFAAETTENTIELFKTDPTEAAKLTAQAAAVAFVLIYWELSLQFIGLWSLGLSTYLWISSYDSPGDWLDDTASKASNLVSGLSKITPPSLPTLPAASTLPALPGKPPAVEKLLPASKASANSMPAKKEE